MTYKMSMNVCLLWVCVLVGGGGFLTAVRGQPTVSLTIETPVADIREGGTVRMRCKVWNLVADQLVEFARPSTVKALIWNGTFINSLNSRLTFSTEISNGVITPNFTITNLQREDTDEYACNVNDPISSGGNEIVASSNVSLSVLYFPESSPTCSPDDPVTVDTGTEISLQCTSEAGNSAVMMAVSEISATCETYTWTTSVVNDTLQRSLTFTAGASTNNASFNCTISSVYYPGMKRSCTIGPITVNGVTGPAPTCPPDPTTETMDYNATQGARLTSLPTSSNQTVIIAGASAAGVVALVVIALVLLMCRRRGICKQPPPKLISDLNSNSEPRTDTAGYINVCNTSSTLPQTEEASSPPVYAKPQKSKTLGVNADPKMMMKDGNSPGNATAKQCYPNAAFRLEGGGSLTLPSRNIATPDSKPIAVVSPVTKAPKKPQPYKPKDKRVSDALPAVNQQYFIATSRPKSAPAVPLGGDVFYAQVQISMTENNVPSETPSSDHIVYADLDLQRDPAEDGDEASSASPVAVYAQVNKNRPI